MFRLRFIFSLALTCCAMSGEATAQPEPACGPATAEDAGLRTMQHDGIERAYRVAVPPGYVPEREYPLILLFHGWGGDENEFLDIPVVEHLASRRGYILVAPRGLGSGQPDQHLNSWTFRGSATGVDGYGGVICDGEETRDYSYLSCRESGVAKNSCSWTHCQGAAATDVPFALALLEEVAEQWCIDRQRVYASGSSNGGMFTWELGQNPLSASAFRALAPIIGLPHRGYLDGPPAGARLPVLLITGTGDPTVPPGAREEAGYTTTFDGDRYHYASATSIMRSWSLAHGCPIGTPASVFDSGTEEADCRTYCDSGSGWPDVLDCRADMAHVNGLSWSWKLILDFFDAKGAQETSIMR